MGFEIDGGEERALNQRSEQRRRDALGGNLDGQGLQKLAVARGQIFHRGLRIHVEHAEGVLLRRKQAGFVLLPQADLDERDAEYSFEFQRLNCLTRARLILKRIEAH